MTKKQAQQQNLFTIAHTNYERELKKYSFFKVHNYELAEDLVQDTFMKTWNYLSKGGKIDTMKSFLYHVLNCLIIDEYRRRKATSLDAMIENGFESGEDDFEHIIDELDSKATALVIEKLPEKYREILSMRYVKDLTIEEMAKATHLSKNTIAVQIHRGLGKLKELLVVNKTARRSSYPAIKHAAMMRGRMHV